MDCVGRIHDHKFGILMLHAELDFSRAAIDRISALQKN